MYVNFNMDLLIAWFTSYCLHISSEAIIFNYLPTRVQINLIAKTYCLFTLTLLLTLHNNTLLYGGQRSYGLKTTTAGTATRIEVKRHSNRPDPVLYSKVILYV